MQRLSRAVQVATDGERRRLQRAVEQYEDLEEMPLGLRDLVQKLEARAVA